MIISAELALRLALAFAAGAVIVAFVTTLADIYGEGPAGFIGGLPTSGAVNLLSIGLTQSTSAAVQATTLFPLGFSCSFAFLLIYTIPNGLQFWTRILVAVGLWLPISAAVAIWGPDDFGLSVGASVVVCLTMLLARRSVATAKAGFDTTNPSAELTILRGALGGFVVTGVLILSLASGPVVGGVFAAAPAIWSSSLYVTSRTQGVEFSRSLTWTFMQAGILTVIPYGAAVRYLFPLFGAWLGTLFAYAAISPLAYLAWRVANRTKV